MKLKKSICLSCAGVYCGKIVEFPSAYLAHKSLLSSHHVFFDERFEEEDTKDPPPHHTWPRYGNLQLVAMWRATCTSLDIGSQMNILNLVRGKDQLIKGEAGPEDYSCAA